MHAVLSAAGQVQHVIVLYGVCAVALLFRLHERVNSGCAYGTEAFLNRIQNVTELQVARPKKQQLQQCDRFMGTRGMQAERSSHCLRGNLAQPWLKPRTPELAVKSSKS